MASVVKSFGISGIDGYLVNIETDTIYGQPLCLKLNKLLFI